MALIACQQSSENSSVASPSFLAEWAFNDCVQHTFLLWLPCVVFWLLVPCELVRLRRSSVQDTRCSKLDIARVVILVCIIASVLVLLVCTTIHFTGMSYWRWAIAFSFGGLLVSFVTCLYLVIAQQKKRVPSCPAAWMMTFACLPAGLFEFSTSFEKLSAGVGATVSSVFILYYIFCLLALILLSFSSAAAPFAEEESTDQRPWPEEYCSFSSQLFYSWFTKLLWTGYKRALELRDVWFVSHNEQTSIVYAKYAPYWHHEYGPVIYSKRFGTFASPKKEEEIRRLVKRPSLIRVILKTSCLEAVEAGVLKLINDALLFVEPFVVKLMIAFYVNRAIPTWHGFVYVTLVGVAMIIKAAALQRYFNIMTRLGVKVRTAIVSTVYRKSLRLTSESRSAWTTGEIVNLMSVDAARFRESAAYVQLIWSAPLQIIIGIICIYTAVGHAVWAGVGFLVVVVVANSGACKVFQKLTEKQMAEKDKRMKLLTEVLNGIKVIKLYAWELAFQRQVETIRTKELTHIRNASYIGGMMEFAWNSTTIFSCLIIFGTYLHISPTNALTAELVFFVIAVFRIIDFPLAMIPNLLADLIMVTVSVKRLSNFFSAQERIEGQIMRSHSGAGPAIKVSRGNFTWNDKPEQEPTLRDIDFEVGRGQLWAVVGQVGCGKSSLLAAICGEMHKVTGYVQVDGSMAYAAQHPWIQNATLRDNVLFGKNYDETFYKQILSACALELDIAMLAGGDSTEIGERGVNLSGGQKQRLSLARAAYQNQDIYLFDDPLSAVDVYVGRHLFDNLIGPSGVLQGKARILVTHDLTYLSQCDVVVVMNNGAISEMGTYRQLMNRKGVLTALVKEFRANQRVKLEKKTELTAEEIMNAVVPRRTVSEKRASKWSSSDNVRHPHKNPIMKKSLSQNNIFSIKTTAITSSNGSVSAPLKAPDPLISEETVQVGKASWSVYSMYARTSGFSLLFYLLFLALANICEFLSSIWLQQWTDSIARDQRRNINGTNVTVNGTANEATSASQGLLYYGLCAAGQVFFIAIFVIFFAYFQVQAAKRIHIKLLYSILRAPLSFFHATPTGRIVNRCGKDVNTVDNEIPGAFDQVAHCFFFILQAIIGIIYATPMFAIAVVPLFVMYWMAQRFYVKTSRQLRRLEAVTRSPLYSHFQESLHGVSTIRAFDKEEQFIEKCSRFIDTNNSAQIALLTSNRWVGMRLEIMGALLVCTAAFVIVLMRNEGLTLGLVGLSLSFALSMTGLWAWAVQQTSVLETEIVAVERINEYINTPPEADWSSRKPLARWPIWGGIEFRNYSVQYRPDLKPVLRNVTLKVHPGNKVGVIGRTGAGKTSLTLGLFRLVEPCGGQILIDEIDIGSIGLHDLRKKLTVIPQDPVLFTGTLRFNIDPFEEYDDEAVWLSLERSQLKAFVSSLPDNLSHEITEGGSNLSVGQRQLVCLARALLKKSKVIVLDEATAAVDTETDALVLQTVRTHFQDCTVIIIAHRLNSVRGCDMIMVLESGSVIEYDKPETLLQRPDSYYRMITDAHAGQFSHSSSGS